MRKRFLFGCFLLFLAQNSFAQTPPPVRFFLEGMYQRASIDGKVEWPELDVIGSELDLDGTFDFDDSNALHGKLGIILHHKHEFLLDYRGYHFPEATSAKTSFNVNGITVPFNMPISAEIEFRSIGLFYGFRFLESQTGYFSIRPGIEFIEYAVDLESRIFDIEVASLEYSDDHTLPFVMLSGEYHFHPSFSVAGEFSGGFMDERTAYFARPMLKFQFHPNISVLAGYSQVWYHDEASEDGEFEITLSGPIVGVQMVW